MMQTITGLESLIDNPPPTLQGSRLGLLTNPTGIDRAYRSTVDLLTRDRRFELRTLFGPEHGVRGDAQAGQHIETSIDARTGLPSYSLYGGSRTPTPEMLDGIDVLVIDLQDIGVRFTTYISTVARVIDACADADVEMVILDRPNPLGGAVHGNTLESEYESFVGIHEIPTIHGLTLAEFGLLYARDRGKPRPSVVPMIRWNPADLFDQTGLPWVMPTPNLPTLDSVIAFQATCLIEGTNLSEGRGTTRPFEMFGAPWLDPYVLIDELATRNLAGVALRPTWFTPSFSKHVSERCAGIFLHVTDRDSFDPIRFGCHLLDCLRVVGGEGFQWLEPSGDRWFIDLLTGTSDLRTAVDSGSSIEDLVESWDHQREAFIRAQADILLYDRP
jgi:uncharacterized protein YbbC (DUF1343 family)